jgi:hypothetical protein
MRTFIKIYGPPFVKAVRALEKIAMSMPEVSIMNTLIAAGPQTFGSDEGVAGYFSAMHGGEISVERRGKIISKYGELLGDYDFFFEWIRDPTMKDINDLADKIDEALSPLGCKYTITSKR